MERVHAIVIDEAHCIDAWGKSFRRAFGSIAKLRLKVHGPTSFLAVSATLSQAVLQRTTKSLLMDDFELINVGNDRPNIRLSVKEFRSPMKSFRDLQFLGDKVRTMVYFNTREQAEAAGHRLRGWFGNDFAQVYHAFKTDDLKKKRMDDFRAGKFPVLLATEAAGMGCDLPNVVRVVQFDYPADLNSLVQRIGRAARDPSAQGFGIFLFPAYRSAKDPDLQKLIAEQTCRRRFLNNYYQNKHVVVDKKLCCDLCDPDATFVLPTVVRTKRKPVERRTPGQKSLVRDRLAAWRSEAYLEHYEGSIHDTEETVLTNSMLERFVEKHSRIASPGSLAETISWSPVKNAFKGQVESILIGLNDQFRLEKQGILDARGRRRLERMPFTEDEYMSYYVASRGMATEQIQEQDDPIIDSLTLSELEDAITPEPVSAESAALKEAIVTVSEPVPRAPSPAREVCPNAQTPLTTPEDRPAVGNDLKFIAFKPKPTLRRSKRPHSQKPRTQQSITDFFRLDLE